MQEPIKYVKHDVSAHDDDALYRLTVTFGMAYYGWYWLLVELLTARRGHYYDVSDDIGWRQLSRDMSCMSDMSIDECRDFIGNLYESGLVSKRHFDELGHVTMERILRDSRVYAEGVAKKKIGAWKTNRKRLLA